MKTTSTTPVCGCEFERETHAVAHSHTPASLLERKPKSVILLRSSQLEFPLLHLHLGRTDLPEHCEHHGADGWMC